MKGSQTARQRGILADNADVGAFDLAIFDQAAGDVLGGVDADGEAQALGAHDHRRVDTDHLSLRVHERSTGVSGIQGGIGLHNAFDKPSRLRAHGASECAHHARGYGRLKAERVTDSGGVGRLTACSNFQALPGYTGLPDPQHGEIGIGIFAN